MSEITAEVSQYSDRELIRKLIGQTNVIETMEKAKSKAISPVTGYIDIDRVIRDRKELREAITNEMLRRMSRTAVKSIEEEEKEENEFMQNGGADRF